MFTRALFSILVVLGCRQNSMGQSKDKEAKVLSKEEVRRLLPLGWDLVNDNEKLTKYQKLVSAGAAAHPALIELLEQANDLDTICMILSILGDSTSDNTRTIEATKKLLTRFSGTDNNSINIRSNVAVVLGKIGRSQDKEILFGLLGDNSYNVRWNTLRALSKVGSKADVARIQAIIGKRKAHLTADEIKKDPSLSEAEKVIQQLKQKAK